MKKVLVENTYTLTENQSRNRKLALFHSTYSLRMDARKAVRAEGGPWQASQAPLTIHTYLNNKPTLVV